MKKLMMVLAVIFATSIAALAQNQQTDSTVNVKTEVKTVEQHIQSLDSVVQSISTNIAVLKNESHADTNNNFGLKDFGEDVLLPIIAVIFTLGMPIIIILIVFIFKHKNRKEQYALAAKALEAGKDIPVEFFAKKNAEESGNLMAKGVKNAFLGLGLGIFLWALTSQFGLGCIGFMIMFIGIGQIVIHKTQGSSEKPNPFTGNTQNGGRTGVTEIKVDSIEINNQEQADQNQTEK